MAKFYKEERLYTVELCESNPDTLFVFGDNGKRYGKAGQAVIRYCDNSHGIITKYAPETGWAAYFSDLPKELDLIKLDFYSLILKSKYYKKVAIPAGGIGTGLSKMRDKSPLHLMYINDFFQALLDAEPKDVELLIMEGLTKPALKEMFTEPKVTL